MAHATNTPRDVIARPGCVENGRVGCPAVRRRYRVITAAVVAGVTRHSHSGHREADDTRQGAVVADHSHPVAAVDCSHLVVVVGGCHSHRVGAVERRSHQEAVGYSHLAVEAERAAHIRPEVAAVRYSTC